VIDLGAILAPVWVEAAGLGKPLAFGCVPLAPADFFEHSDALASFIVAAAAAAAENAPEKSRIPTRAEIQHMQVIAVLTVRQVRDEDGNTIPFRFVLQEADEDEGAARVWVGRLPVADVCAIAGSGIAQAMDAARRAAGFRRERTVDAASGRDGEAVRDAPGAPSGAA